MPAPPSDVVRALGHRNARLEPITATEPEALGNGNWHLWTAGGDHHVLRRYHVLQTPAGLAYEAEVLDHLAVRGWTVPTVLAGPVRHDERLWAVTRFVPGAPHAAPATRTKAEPPAQQVERGEILARLHADLSEVDRHQRDGFSQGCDLAAMGASQDWDAGVAALHAVRPDLAEWAAAAMTDGLDLVARRHLLDLPQTVVHGDFAEWNLHFTGSGGLSGVVDFALTHRDSRSWELVVARVHRSPELLTGYQRAATELGRPLTEPELAAVEPLERVFRIAMVMAELWGGQRHGRFDLAVVERQLARTGTPRP